MRYLVTGGAGFIGSCFVRHLLDTQEDAQVVTLDLLTYAGHLENLRDVAEHPRHRFVEGDIRDEKTVGGLLERHRIQAVVNFAAESHVDRSITGPRAFVDTNVSGTANLLECARRYWDSGGGHGEARRFLQVSTDEVYGSLGEEGLFREDTPLDPHSPYSASKAGADLLALAYAHTHGLWVGVTRCSNNYGPRQHPEKLIPLTIRRALERRPVPVYGDGRQVRDWLHVSDHCRAISAVLRRGAPGRVYNVGGSCERANLAVVEAILQAVSAETGRRVGTELVTHVEDRKGHDRRYGIDAGRIRAELGWTPLVPFHRGLRETVAWYVANRAWMDTILQKEQAT